MRKPFVETSVVRADIGTFKSHRHTEPGIALPQRKQLPPSAKSIAARDFADQIRSQDRNVSVGAQAALLAEMRIAVGALGSKHGLTEDQIDEAVGDAMVQMVDYTNKGKPIGHGLVQVRAMSIVYQYTNNHMRHESVSAIKKLKERQIAEEIHVQRLLTRVEVDALAESIRQSWPDKNHRPAPGFQRPEFSDPDVIMDLEQMLGLEASGQIGAADKAPRSWESNSKIDRAIDSLTRSQLHSQMYDLYAEEEGLPPAQSAVIPATIARRMADAIDGRVSTVARDFILTGAEGRDTAALFAPFGHLTPSQKDVLAGAFAGKTWQAEPFWRAALDTATLSEADARRQARVQEKLDIAEAQRLSRIDRARRRRS